MSCPHLNSLKTSSSKTIGICPVTRGLFSGSGIDMMKLQAKVKFHASHKCYQKTGKLCKKHMTFKGNVKPDDNDWLQFYTAAAHDQSVEESYIHIYPFGPDVPDPITGEYPNRIPSSSDQVLAQVKYQPWSSIATPWRNNQESPDPSANTSSTTPAGVFSNSLINSEDIVHNKAGSIPWVLAFYAGLLEVSEPQDSEKRTVFLKNFVERGPSNEDKRIYMSAVLGDKIGFYKPKTRAFLEKVRTRALAGEPLISVFREELMKYFVSIHTGEEKNYPAFVIDYYTTFMDIVGNFANPETNVDPTESLMKGYLAVPDLKNYFEQRLRKVMKEEDKTTLAYHWTKAGMSSDAFITESVHNIVAFSQFAHVFYLSVVEKTWANSPQTAPLERWEHPQTIPSIPLSDSLEPFSVGPVDFFAKYKTSVEDEETALDGVTDIHEMRMIKESAAADRLDISRELYRLMTPNGNSFSLLSPEGDVDGTGVPHGVPVEVNHIWVFLMISNTTPNPYFPPGAFHPDPIEDENIRKTITHFFYDTSKYAQWRTSLLECNLTSCPSLQDIYNHNHTSSDKFSFSKVDNNPNHNDGTLLDAANEKLIPVFDKPIYLPFGMKDRRCPGEILDNEIMQEILDVFMNNNFEMRDPGNEEFYDDLNNRVGIAPSKSPYDTIYIVV